MVTSILKQIIFALLAVCLFQTAHAHESILGKVVDDENGIPIWGANVVVPGTNQGAVTDELGKFVLLLDSMPEYIRISYIGYEPIEIQTPDDGEEMQIALSKSSLKLKEVNVQSGMQDAGQEISAIDLSISTVNSSQEILRRVPGLFIGQHAGGGKAEQIFLRGYDIDHGTDIAISVDGMPVNMVSHAHGQGYADLHFLIPELIDKVSFAKGTYDVSEGNFATAGQVRFSTLNALDKNRAQIEVGRFNTFRFLGMTNLLKESFQAKTNQQAFMATEVISSDGPFESEQNFKRFNIFYKHSFKLSDKNFLKLQASHFRSSWDASGQIPETAVEEGIISRFGAIDDDEGGETSRSNVSLQLNSYLSEHSSFKSQIYYSNYKFTLFSNFTFFLEDQENGDRIKQQENRNIVGGQSVYTLAKQKNGVQYSTQIGMDIRYDWVDDNELSRVIGRDTILEQLAFGNVDESNWSVFASEDIRVGKWRFNFGARIDYFNFRYLDKLNGEAQSISNAATINPKVRVAYQATPNVQMYLKAGTGFHSNDTRSAVNAPNTSAILPRVYGLDLGSKFKLAERVFVDVTAWTLKQDNELVYVGDAGIVEENGQSIRAGLDFSIRAELLDFLFLENNINYTFARSLEASTGENFIPLAASFTSTGGLYMRHESGIGGSISYRHIADRPANEDFSLTALGYTLMDLSLSYTAKRYEIACSLENVLNTEWREAQFETTSRITPESEERTSIHFTPGTPINFRTKFAFFF